MLVEVVVVDIIVQEILVELEELVVVEQVHQ
jgi:hypothetical protein